MEQKKHRIGGFMVVVLVILSGIADLITLIPFIGTYAAPIYFALLSWYLWKTGHGLFNWKTAVPEGISLVAEFIPIVQALPTMITATVIIIAVSRFEDKTGLKLTPGSKKPGTRLPDKPAPLNSDGVRPPRKV